MSNDGSNSAVIALIFWTMLIFSLGIVAGRCSNEDDLHKQAVLAGCGQHQTDPKTGAAVWVWNKPAEKGPTP